MQVVCPNPSCGAVYTVGPQHAGKQFPCRSCGTTVVVGADVAAPAAPAVAVTAAAADAAAAYVPRNPIGGRIRADLFTFVLGFGAMLVLVFSFLPALDMGKAIRQDAKVKAGDLSLEMDREELNKKHGSPMGWPTADRDAVEKKQKDWDGQRRDLQRDLREMQITAGGNLYWYTWGVLLSSLLVLGGAVGYMSTGATRTRRVVGGVLVVFVVLMVMTTYNVVSITSALNGSRLVR